MNKKTIADSSTGIAAIPLLCAVPSVDLFGNEIVKKELLRDKFIEPPFSVLNSTNGNWQKRKNKWKRLGLKSEVGRSLYNKKEHQGIGALFGFVFFTRRGERIRAEAGRIKEV